MNNELMQNEDFIRCSTMIAELLMKYKAMEDKDAEESGMQETASCPLVFLRSAIEKSIVIVYIMNCRCLLLTKNERRECCPWKTPTYIPVFQP